MACGRYVAAWPEVAIYIDGGTLLSALFSTEALADDKAFANAIDAFSSACRRKRIL